MFRVAQFEVEDYGIVDRTIFRSFSEQDCWDFVQSRLEVAHKSDQKPLRFYVLDKVGQFIDEPHHITSLRHWTTL